MTADQRGFFLERLTVVGAGLPVAQIDLRDGLNVIAGASDTGKSYLCSLIDFAFGASSAPAIIEQATGYSSLVLRVHDRRSHDLHDIERSLAGGDVKIRRFDSQGNALGERLARGKHAADDPTTLSAFFLALSGFGSPKVRKNKRGETRTVSFRDIAFLTVVDETRIISTYPPQLSGSPVEATAESEVFRLLVIGAESTAPITVPLKADAQSAKAQLALVQQLADQVERDIAALQLGSSDLANQLAAVDQARVDLLKSYEASRLEIVEAERGLADQAQQLRAAESRLAIVEGLFRRFELLEKHYQSDLDRLAAVEEAGMMLEALPTATCPICGAPAEAHRPEQAAAHFRVDDVRAAAEGEAEKITRLRADLQKALSDLSLEATALEVQRGHLRKEITEAQSRVSQELRPRVRASAEELQRQDARRDLLLQGRVLDGQLVDLRARAAQLEVRGLRAKARAPLAQMDGATTASMESFAQQVEEILKAWRLPESGRVVFAEDSQDLVIGGQPRSSHGKGVRALGCSAFLLGLMRHCIRADLPHPGLVVLDSPLVAYKDPDLPGSESARLREAGVKDFFFRSLADGLCSGQVIVFENEDPPVDLGNAITYHHFTKSSIGRYGFFPKRP
jgi:hypothetical protein